VVGVIRRLVPVKVASVVMKGIRAPSITQTMNEMSKCRNAQRSVGGWPLLAMLFKWLKAIVSTEPRVRNVFGKHKRRGLKTAFAVSPLRRWKVMLLRRCSRLHCPDRSRSSVV
jgi:hypothetical protein